MSHGELDIQGPDGSIDLDDAALDSLMALPAHDDDAKARRIELVTSSHRPYPETDTCRFELDVRGHDRRRVELTPPVVMKPFAVLLWGVGRGALVHQIVLRHEEQLVGAVPAHLFESDIARLTFLDHVRPRPDGLGIVDTSVLGKLFRFDMPVVTPSDRLWLDVSGFIAHGVVLGRTPSLSRTEPEGPLEGADSNGGSTGFGGPTEAESAACRHGVGA